MQMHIEGHIGERLTVYIDHDSARRTTSIGEVPRGHVEEVIREINAGEIDIKMRIPSTPCTTTPVEGLGMDVTLKRTACR
jgi:hypothetical protein